MADARLAGAGTADRSAGRDGLTIGIGGAIPAVGGLVVLGWALTSATFRDAEGAAVGRICLPVSLAFSLWILAGALSRPAWLRCGAWAALSLLGQAVALQMIDAGKWIHFQHLRPVSHLAQHDPWLLAFVAAQAIAVIAALRPLDPWSWLRRRYRPWALLAIAGAFLAASATLSRHPVDYAAELAFATFLQAVNLGSIVVAAIHIPEGGARAAGRLFDRILGTDAPRPLRAERLMLCGAAWVTLVSAFLAAFVYQKHPHVADEVMYLFHARYLAEGHLSIDAPPVPEAFKIYLAEMENGRLYATPPAAWPLVLSLGVRAGVPWLVNPLLGGLNVLLAFLLCRNILGARYARLAILLLCASPWYLFMCMNYMTHTLTFTCFLAAALGVFAACRTGGSAPAAAAGVAIGFTSLIRPLDGLLTGVIVSMWSLGPGRSRLSWRSMAAMALGAAFTGALVLPYNRHFTNNPAQFPLNRYLEVRFGKGVNDLGFGPDKGLPFGGGMDAFPGHGLPDVIANGLLNLAGLNTELHGWACGSLAAILLLLLSGRMAAWDRWMAAAILVTFLGYSTYWFSGGPDFGARYWYLMLLPLLALTASAIRHLEGETGSSPRVLAAAAALAVFALLNYVPWRAIDKYYHYLLMRPDIPQIAAQHGFGRDLVVVRGLNHPDYSSAWIYNPLRWTGGEPVYASYPARQRRAELLNAFPDRRIWILDGPTITQAGYQVRGPVEVAEFLNLPDPETKGH